MKTRALFMILLPTSFIFSSAWAHPPCSPSVNIGDECEVIFPLLHPTQTALGFREVQQKAAQISGMSHDKLDQYFEDHLLPIIFGPHGLIYVTDHQHMARAAELDGILSAYAQVLADYTNLNEDQFWKQMELKNWVYLFDEKGNKLSSPASLPASIAEMKDDPYRSLAGAARDDGCYQKTKIFFADFQWANFFRTRIAVGVTDGDFKKALKLTEKICHTQEASSLPGYIP